MSPKSRHMPRRLRLAHGVRVLHHAYTNGDAEFSKEQSMKCLPLCGRANVGERGQGGGTTPGGPNEWEPKISPHFLRRAKRSGTTARIFEQRQCLQNTPTSITVKDKTKNRTHANTHRSAQQAPCQACHYYCGRIRHKARVEKYKRGNTHGFGAWRHEPKTATRIVRVRCLL